MPKSPRKVTPVAAEIVDVGEMVMLSPASNSIEPPVEVIWTAGRTTMLSFELSSAVEKRMFPPARTFAPIVSGLCTETVIGPVAWSAFAGVAPLAFVTPPTKSGPVLSSQMPPPNARAATFETTVSIEWPAPAAPMAPVAESQTFGAVTFAPLARPLKMLPESAWRYAVSVPAPDAPTVPR